MKGLGFVILSVVCTFLREVSLVICKGKSVVLELIVAKADVRCIHTRIRKPSCTQTLCLLRVAFGMITISTTCKPPLSQVFQCTLIITQLCFCAYTPLFFIWVRFSISVFAEITGCSISCHTEFRHRSEPVFLLSLLCIEDDHWKIISATHTHTHTYHKHRCMNTNTVTVQLYCAYQDRKNIWFVFSGKNKRDFQDFVIIMLIIFFTLSYVFIFFLLFFFTLLVFYVCNFLFFPLFSFHPCLQRCQSLRRTDVSSRCWSRLAGDREGRGLSHTSFLSSLVFFPQAYIFNVSVSFVVFSISGLRQRLT